MSERHPDVRDDDVRAAWANQVAYDVRESFTGDRYVCIGIDGRGRALEMVAAMDRDEWVVFHAMTPPTRKMMSELGIVRRGPWA